MITSVITKKGRILQNKQVNGATIKFTKVVAGSANTPIDELKDKIGVSSVVQTLSIQSITQNENEQAYTILVLLENTNLTKSYSLNQIGFYASDPNEGEILFAIAQFDTPKKIETPLVEPGYTLEMHFKFQNSNDANIEIEFNPENLMSRAGVADMLKSEEISGKATGNEITVTDSAESPFLDFKLFGKSEQVTTKGYQLFDASKLETTSSNGATVTNNDDGSFNISGTETTNVFGYFHGYSHEETVALLRAGNITLKTGKATRPYVYMSLHKSSAERLFEINNADRGEKTLEILEEWLNDESVYMRIGFYGGANTAVTPANIKPMLYQDGDGTWEKFSGGKPSPSPEFTQEIESTGDDGSVEITTTKKNLYNCRDVVEGEIYNGGVIGNDDFITIEYDNTAGMNTAYKNFWTHPIKHLKKNTDYRIVVEVKELVNCGLYAVSRKTPEFTESQFKENLIIQQIGTFSQVIRTNDADWTGTVYALRSFVQFSAGYSGKCVFRISLQQVEDLNTDYVSYSESKADIPTPNGLHGVPVPSGGNYTDENGQEWICNEINIAKRKYIKRVQADTFDGSSDEVINIAHSGTENYYYDFKASCVLLRDYGFSTHYSIGNIFSTNTENGFLPIAAQSLRVRYGYELTIEELRTQLGVSPITFVYALATPIETDLTDEQIAAFESLTTYESTTNIFMDGIGNMEVTYFKDTDNGKAMGMLKGENIYLKKLIGDINSVVKGLVG